MSLRGPEGLAARGPGLILLVAFAFLVVALSWSPVSNNDIFLHLRTGQLVLETGSPPHVDDYSALARGRPFVAHEWLAGVLFRLTERLAGFTGLVLLKVGIALAIAATLYDAARILGAPLSLSVPLLALTMILAGARIMERPHLFSYLLMSVVLWLLARRRMGRPAPLWVLPWLQIAWANLHGAFLLGPLIVFLAAAAQALEAVWGRLEAARGRRRPARSRPEAPADPRGRPRKTASGLSEASRLAITALLMTAACLINPYGFELLKFPFQLTGSAFMGEIYEWQPPLTSDFALTYMAREYVVLAAIGIGVLVGAAIRVFRGPDAAGVVPPEGIFTWLLFGVLGALSLRMQRNVTDFALGTYPGIAATAGCLLPPRRPARPAAVRLGLAAICAVVAIGFLSAGYPYRPGSRRAVGLGIGRNIPVAAGDYVEARGLRGNAFTSYAAGAYLIERFYPRVRVTMDSRNDVYGIDLYTDYQRALVDEGALRAMLERVDASFIFLQWTEAPAATTLTLARRLGWAMVYFDDVAVVMVHREGPYARLAGQDGYSIPDPATYRPVMPPAGDERRSAGDLLLRESTRAATTSGGSWVARVMQVNALLMLGRDDEARQHDERILAERPAYPFIYGYLGRLRLAVGDRQGALERFHRGLALSPRDPTCLQGLAVAGG